MSNKTYQEKRIIKVAAELIEARLEEASFVNNSAEFISGYQMALEDLVHRLTEYEI